MRRFLAIVLSILIGVQGMVWIPEGMKVQAEDAAEVTGGNEAGQGEVQEDADGTGAQEEEADDETGDGQNAEETEARAGDGETEEGQPEEEAGPDGGGASGVEISVPSAILMESSTGKVIYEKDADTRRPPASVTKIMTLLLIFDALADNRITLEDEVQTSEYAASMGGSQVFLEPGETQTVDTMIKCIAVASANDACVSFKNSRQYFDSQ